MCTGATREAAEEEEGMTTLCAFRRFFVWRVSSTKKRVAMGIVGRKTESMIGDFRVFND